MATSAKRKTDESAATAADRAPKSLPKRSHVTDSDIARRAHDRYLARGAEDGHDVDDWLQAERELQSDPEC
jgi:Protein of unknown function (DUF2934)